MSEADVHRRVDAVREAIEGRYYSAESVTWKSDAAGFLFTVLKPDRPFVMWIERAFFTDREYTPDDVRTKFMELRIFDFIERCAVNERVVLLADGEMRIERIV